jgi:transposase
LPFRGCESIRASEEGPAEEFGAGMVNLGAETMSYRPYSPPTPLLFGYDPVRDLPPDHLARLVEEVVEESVRIAPRPRRQGQPPYDPRLCLKVLLYGYATGIRSSRKLEQLCRESLPYLYLTRGDAPSYRTLCTVRLEEKELIEEVYVGLFAVGETLGLKRVGRITIDSTKIRADVSPESVVKPEEYEAVRAELAGILAEAAAIDAREEAEGPSGETRTGKTLQRDQMRDILRRVRSQRAVAKRERTAKASGQTGEDKPEAAAGLALEGLEETTSGGAGGEPQEPPPVVAKPPLAGRISQRMRERVEAALQAIDQAAAAGRKHLSLTDPDAVMMGEGREKRIRECHAFEVAVDNGLLVVGQTCQEGTDNARLLPVVEAAKAHEPAGVKAVDADSGYYAGDAVAALIEAGVDTCIPDSNTAGDLHRGQPVGTIRSKKQGAVAFEYDAAADLYRCPQGQELALRQTRQEGGCMTQVYRAREECRPCPQAGECLTQLKAQHRTLKVPVKEEVLERARQRFNEPEHQARYHQRGPEVESVFGFLRGVLGYGRWLLRGKEKVEREGRLFTVAYQMRKVHAAWARA